LSRYYNSPLRELGSLAQLFGPDLVGGEMCDPVDVTVGRRLKARRRLLGITQKGLANYCGVTFQQIQKYECAVSRVSATMLWRLACVLDVDVSYFFTGITRERAAPLNQDNLVSQGGAPPF
jgi:DNA-binding XRE family transcriptional regulator